MLPSWLISNPVSEDPFDPAKDTEMTTDAPQLAYQQSCLRRPLGKIIASLRPCQNTILPDREESSGHSVGNKMTPHLPLW